MRRVNGIALLTRAAISMGGPTTATSATQHRLVQTAMLSTCSNSNPLGFAQGLGDLFGLSKPSSVPRCAGGHMCFSANAVASVAQEVHPHVKSLPKDVVLYQYEACPFCNKVRAFLDYYNIPYKVMEVNPINRKRLNDIIDKLHRRINPENALNSEEEKKWRGWVDKRFVHVLSLNLYRTVSKALESFDYITRNFSSYERMVAKYAGAAATYFVSKKLKKRYNITDERAALYGVAETWVDALKGRQFLGGSNPNLADLAVFGVLRPIRHLKSGKDMVENTRIGEWYNRMESAVGE
ncbi:unnamed protein product [Malus baccata var. baccata]